MGYTIEVDVDNFGKYIPEGWQRKLYKYTRGVLEGRFVIRYISPYGKVLYNKKHVSKYIKLLESEGITELVKVENMDFSCLSYKQKRKRKKLKEIEVDNSEIYVPEGWQRKLYEYKYGNKTK